jgi:hypothetical protein
MLRANNVFALLGDLETALTKSLGFMLNHNKSLLYTFLRTIGILDRKSLKSVRKAEVEIEVPDRHGRTDIEVKFKDVFYVIIECKVGGNLPSKQQLQRYCQKLLTLNGERKLCVITEVDSKDWFEKEIFGNSRTFAGLPKNDIIFLTWQELHENFFSDLDLNDEFDRHFEDYLEKMIMQNEILVVSADPDPKYGEEDVYFYRKHHIYWYSVDTMKKRHNYIALYLPKQFKKDQGIQEIARILRYELCSLDQLGLPKDSNYYKRLKASDTGRPRFYKLVLGEPIKLVRKIKKSRGKRVRNWTTTFEKLLQAEFTDELLLSE